MGLTAGDWAALTGGVLTGLAADQPVGQASLDSRQISPGQVYVAVRGARVDGHDYAVAAAAAGAGLALVERPVPVPHLLVPDVIAALASVAKGHLAALRHPGWPLVVAVTGSVGKTTTKDLIARLASAAAPTVAAKASFNNHFGLPLTVLRTTTNTAYLILEMGANHRGEIAALTTIAPPDIAVVLGVGSAHLGEFGSVAAIAQAKSELPAALTPSGRAVLNADDDRVMAMTTPGRQLTFGAKASADVRINQTDLDAKGYLMVDLTVAGRNCTVHTALTGRHHAINLAAALATGWAMGIDLDLALATLDQIGPDSPHRMALRPLAGGAVVMDDAYNANPASMAAALAAVAEQARLSARPAVAVVGEMLELGSGSAAAHRAVGQLAGELGLELVIAVGTGAQAVLDGARAAGMGSDAVVFVETIAQARDRLAPELTRNSLILVKGSLNSGLWRLADQLAGGGPC